MFYCDHMIYMTINVIAPYDICDNVTVTSHLNPNSNNNNNKKVKIK